MTNALVELALWCKANVPDGRISVCRIEHGCKPCQHLCGDCLLVEKAALAALEKHRETQDRPSSPEA
jgi:hypothetical protein